MIPLLLLSFAEHRGAGVLAAHVPIGIPESPLLADGIDARTVLSPSIECPMLLPSVGPLTPSPWRGEHTR